MKWYEAVAEMAKGKVMQCDTGCFEFRQYRIDNDKFQRCIEGVWIDTNLTRFEMESKWIEYVEPIFEAGDWVYIPSMVNGKVKVIKYIHDSHWEFDDGSTIGVAFKKQLQEIRHATGEEVAQEQERRKWAKWGRKVGEYREGDVAVKGIQLVSIFAVLDSSRYWIGGDQYVSSDDLKMICPRELRADWREQDGIPTK